MPPSAEDNTFKILQGIRDLYENTTMLSCQMMFLKAAVDFSVQYIPQRSLPDKAIDLVDVTAAHLAAQHPVTDVNAVEHEIEEEKAKQEAAAAKEDDEAALNAKVRIEELKRKLLTIQQTLKSLQLLTMAESVERMTGIPVLPNGSNWYRTFRKTWAAVCKPKLSVKISKSVEAVARAIRVPIAGFDEGNRPICSLFVGPTGVGKTVGLNKLALDMFRN